MQKTLLIVLLGILSIICQAQTTVHIKGTVRSSSDSTFLPGISIIEKGTSNGTSSNTDGSFSLAIRSGSTIIVSGIGYVTQELKVSSHQIEIYLLPAALGMDEVIVTTALGIQKDKRVLGFATQEVKGEAMTKAREPQVISGLTGRVAGLTINNKASLYETASIALRGKTPLVVIDGIPSQGDLWNLNADDIESINVLKSNAAALLYGSLGVNGALQITTKKGKRGSGVETSINQGFQMTAGWLKLPEYQTQYGMGWKGYYAFIDGKGGGGFYDNYGYVWGPKLDVPDPTTESGWVEYPQYNSPYDPNTWYEFTQNGYTGQSHYKPIPYISRGKKNLQNFMRPQMLYTINANVAARGELGGYRVSLSHMYQRGQIPNTKLNSSAFAVAGDIKISPKIKIEGSLSYNRQFSPNYPDNSYNPENFFYNILLWMGADVDIRDLRDYWKPAGGYEQEGQFKPYGVKDIQQMNYNYSWYNNPWYLAYERLRQYKNDVVVGTASLNYNISDNLSLMIRSGGTFSNSGSELKTPYSFISYSALPYGAFSISSTSRLLFQTDALLTYKKTFGDLDMTIAGGGANRYESYSTNGGSTTGGLQVPKVYNLAMSRDPATTYNDRWEKEVNSVLGYADLGYKNFLNLNISVRNDWSSSLRKPYNSYFYPSASLSFILSDVVRLPDAINFVKLRGAYADVKSDVSPYYTVPTYSSGTRWNGVPSLSSPGSILDSAIRPSRTISREVGLETKFLNNRLGLDLTYYSYLDKDSPRDISLSQASGYSSYRVNGDVYNRRGWEIVLNASPIQNKNFGWDILVNYSRIRNYVKELYGGVESRGLIKVGDRINVDPARWGGELAYTGWVWEKSPDGQIVYENGLPKYLNQLINLGVHEHDFDYGINNAFRLKQFSFSFLLDGRVGGNMFNGVEAKMYEGGSHPATANSYREDSYAGQKTYVGKGVVVTGGDVVYDAFGNIISDNRTFAPNDVKVDYIDWVFATYTNGVTESLLYKQTYLKLREVIIGYNFKPASLNKTPFKSVSISLVGRNLLMFTKVPYMDPEAYSGTTMAEPSYRNVGININLKF